MISIVLLGTGNVATHLFNAFQESTVAKVVQVYNRGEKGLTTFKSSAKTTTCLNELIKADVYIIAISDDYISDFSKILPFKNRLIVHTSGSVSMHNLSNNNDRGVFYPLQTFTKDRAVNFKTIPICVESEKAKNQALLLLLANSISENVYEINSVQREALHVSAVFVNNFVNHLYVKAEEICETHQVPFEILKPLIQETAQKITSLPPKDCQTGPAKRNDQEVIKKQVDYLQEDNQKEIYKILTQSILNTNGNKL